MTRGIVLFGHGSRDPGWRAPMDAVARRIAELSPGTPTRCAFLEMQAPDLPAAVGELVASGATEVTVLPMFLGVGRHAREDLPRLATGVAEAFPGIRLTVLATAGESPELIELLARLALHGRA